MSIERKDVRIKLDFEDHAALALLAEVDDMEMATWAERVLVRELRRRLHAAIVTAERAARAGIAGRAIPAGD